MKNFLFNSLFTSSRSTVILLKISQSCSLSSLVFHWRKNCILNADSKQLQIIVKFGLLKLGRILTSWTSWQMLLLWRASAGSESWIKWIVGLIDWGFHFRVDISLGTIPICFFFFSTFVFRDVPGTVPECVRIYGFKKNSSNSDRGPKMRESVLLSSWDSFLVTLPSISSETCVIWFSLTLGTKVFRNGSFRGCSSTVSLVTAANFRLFLNVAIIWRKMLNSS